MTTTTDQEVNPIENGVQQTYIEIRESIELLLGGIEDHDGFLFTGNQLREILVSLDDAVSNNWDELMTAFWRGVAQDIELMEEA